MKLMFRLVLIWLVTGFAGAGVLYVTGSLVVGVAFSFTSSVILTSWALDEL